MYAVVIVAVTIVVNALEIIIVNHMLSQIKILMAQRTIFIKILINGKETMVLVTASKIKQIHAPFV